MSRQPSHLWNSVDFPILINKCVVLDIHTVLLDHTGEKPLVLFSEDSLTVLVFREGHKHLLLQGNLTHESVTCPPRLVAFIAELWWIRDSSEIGLTLPLSTSILAKVLETDNELIVCSRRSASLDSALASQLPTKDTHIAYFFLMFSIFLNICSQRHIFEPKTFFVFPFSFIFESSCFFHFFHLFSPLFASFFCRCFFSCFHRFQQCFPHVLFIFHRLFFQFSSFSISGFDNVTPGGKTRP